MREHFSRLNCDSCGALMETEAPRDPDETLQINIYFPWAYRNHLQHEQREAFDLCANCRETLPIATVIKNTIDKVKDRIEAVKARLSE